MAFEITLLCVNCTACALVCPNDAISEAAGCHSIQASLCTECVESYTDPQCASICPIEGAIINELGEPLNPPGSLTGVIPRVAA